MGKRLSSTRPHSPPESFAVSKRVPVPGHARSWLPAQHMLPVGHHSVIKTMFTCALRFNPSLEKKRYKGETTTVQPAAHIV